MKTTAPVLILSFFCLGLAGHAPAQQAPSLLIRPVPPKVYEKVISWHQFQLAYPGSADYFHGNVEYGSRLLLLGAIPDRDVTLFASLDIPAGATIRKVTSYWRDDDPAHDLSIEVREHFVFDNTIPTSNLRMDVSSSGNSGQSFDTTVWTGAFGPIEYGDDFIDGILARSLDIVVTFPEGIHESVGLKSVKIEYAFVN